jgi:hypothetical protein
MNFTHQPVAMFDRILVRIATLVSTRMILNSAHRPCFADTLAILVILLASSSANAEFEPVASDSLLALRSEARAYEHGEGVAKDPDRAVARYCAGAKLGDAESQYSLGWMYANARGVPRDDALASFFFALAAKQGHEHASMMLRFVGGGVAEMPECMRDRAAPKPAIHSKAESAAKPQKEFTATTPAQKKVAEIVGKLAPEFGISPQLALAIIRAESNFDPTARSHKNAQGLMQLIPETSARFNVSKPFDPVQNVRGGLAYLRWLLAYFQGNVLLVAAAYNAGEGTVDRYRGLPPFAETRMYVKRIIELFGNKEHPYDASVTSPSPELKRIRTTTVF